MLRRIPTLIRIVFGLVCLTASSLMLARWADVFPDTRALAIKGRAAFCESLAIQMSLLAVKDEVNLMEVNLKAVAARNDQVRSLGVRRANGEMLIAVGDHLSHWRPTADGLSTDSQMFVPIATSDKPWGTVEVCFKPLMPAGWRGVLAEPLVRMLLFMSVLGFAIYYIFLKRVLTQLNPSRVVPGRVRTALDTLTQGLVILDDRQRVVLANEAFAKTLGRTPESLVGRNIGEMPWRNHDDHSRVLREFPWREAFDQAKPKTGSLLDLQVNDEVRRTFVVNAAPVFSDKKRCQGVLVSLEDITPLEQKKKELHFALDQLHQSAEEVRKQNEELERLATTDPLTECLNRRAFFAHFETHWANAEHAGSPLSCIMVDLDYFKAVNDEHGHATGDEMLKGVAGLLRTTARLGDYVCRFGGEEFCVLLPNSPLEEALAAAERFRKAIELSKFCGLKKTASLGVSAMSLGAKEPHEMLDQSDKALYFAKRNGRNQVACCRDVPTDLVIDEKKVSRTRAITAPANEETQATIPYHAVSALLSALAFRHRDTATHCRRVADLCVTVAETRMSFRDCYLVEIAALLHDIGKVGVPDSILLKSGPLTPDEWETMRHQDSMGLEIVHASFSCEPLSQILANRKAFFGGTPHQRGLPTGESIPLGARILAIADAFDSMTHDSVYRAAMTPEQAFAELRACCESQFDPPLVEQFISIQRSRAARNVPESVSVSKGLAVDVGLQIERLVTAIDDQDIERLKALAERLQLTAEQRQSSAIAGKASDLRMAVEEEQELINVLETAHDLVELCRSTQRSFLESPQTPSTRMIVGSPA